MTTLDPAMYRKAADIIREGGLTKGVFDVRQSDGHMAHCTVGALMEATGRPLGNHSTEVEFLGHLLGITPCGIAASVTRWNDRSETTAENVITLLEQAAEKLEAEL